MQHVFLEKFSELRRIHDTYVLATVVAVRGSSSAKTGAKAMISADGRNLFGWVGGGCAESFLIRQSLEALDERRPRLVTVDLDDELLGVGMPCGGYMDVFLEPVFPQRRLMIIGADDLSVHLSTLAALDDQHVSIHAANADSNTYPFASAVSQQAPASVKAEKDVVMVVTDEKVDADLVDLWLKQGAARVVFASDVLKSSEVFGKAGLGATQGRRAAAIRLLAELKCLEGDRDGASLSLNPNTPTPLFEFEGDPEILIIGRGRIAEELARLADILDWRVTVNYPGLDEEKELYPQRVNLISGDLDLNMEEANPGTFVILAGQHKGDHEAALGALKNKAPYIALVASRKRSGLVLDFLKEKGFSEEDLRCVYAPAGLDIHSKTPLDIAISITAEMLKLLEVGRS